MYSPKIAEDLIPVLYRQAKTRGIPMTRLVDEILRRALKDSVLRVSDEDQHPDQVLRR